MSISFLSFAVNCRSVFVYLRFSQDPRPHGSHFRISLSLRFKAIATMGSLAKPDILTLAPQAFVDLLLKNKIQAFHITYDEDAKKTVASHPLLQPIGDYFAAENTDFDRHEGLFGQIGPVSGVLQGAFIHRTCRGAGAGGVRNWIYDTTESWFRDGLRLGKGMTHKNSLALLEWGGAKGVMARGTGKGLAVGDSPNDRQVVYEEYGAFLSRLHGAYVTAEDAGTMPADMAHIFYKTRFTTCIPKEYGGSSGPSEITAMGVLKGVEAALEFAAIDIKTARLAVQGMGNVGSAFVKFAIAAYPSIKIVATDLTHPSPQAMKDINAANFDFRLVQRGDNSVLFEEVDAVIPNAVGGILSPETIPHIKAKVVCGAANNQLHDLDNDDELLASRGITYVPDFVINRMGIVQCADESRGTFVGKDPAIYKHLDPAWSNSIPSITLSVLKAAKEQNTTPQKVALKMAEDLSLQVNPTWGHRAKAIIADVVESTEWLDYCKAA